jgi:hypothetical protein
MHLCVHVFIGMCICTYDDIYCVPVYTYTCVLMCLHGCVHVFMCMHGYTFTLIHTLRFCVDVTQTCICVCALCMHVHIATCLYVCFCSVTVYNLL